MQQELKIIVIEKTKFEYDVEFNDPESLVEKLKQLIVES